MVSDGIEVIEEDDTVVLSMGDRDVMVVNEDENCLFEELLDEAAVVLVIVEAFGMRLVVVLFCKETACDILLLYFVIMDVCSGSTMELVEKIDDFWVEETVPNVLLFTPASRDVEL